MCERHYLEDGRWYRGCFCWAESTTPGDLHLSPWGPKTFIYLPRDKDLSKDIYSPFILLFIYPFIWTLPRISLFPLHSITPNSRLSLMPIFTGVSINCGLSRSTINWQSYHSVFHFLLKLKILLGQT